MILKNNLLILTMAFFLVSCGSNSSSTTQDKEPYSTNPDTDNDGLADKYESSLGLVVGSIDASSALLDPLYSKQWHLKNSVVVDEDINIESVWRETIGEKHITVAIIDSGIDAKHPDIDLDLENSFRYSDKSKDPSPTSSQLYLDSFDSAHGTACAGIVAARGWNNKGVRGIAPNINLVGLNVFSDATDANFADALLRKGIDVSSNSWGGGGSSSLYDDRASLEAVQSGAKTLRNGKGVVYVFAAGNNSRNANFQNVFTSGYVIPVSSVDQSGKFADYSDFGSNILISAPGGDLNYETKPSLITTDITGLTDGRDIYKERWDVIGNENGDYTNTMNGTSASCPIISGVAALMLSVNSDLTYRDVQYILAKTARKNDLKDSSWYINAAGLYFSNKYGFGVVDALKAVEMAKDFSGLAKEYNLSKKVLVTTLLESQKEISYKTNISDDFFVQGVYLDIKTDHSNSGKLKIVIESPSGTKSILAYGDTVLYDDYNPWTLLSFHFLDEKTSGEWKIHIEDKGFANSVSNLELSLKIKGYQK